MKSRAIALLALSLVVLGTVYYFDSRATVRREKAQVERGRVSLLDPEAIDRIEIRNRSGEFALEKRGAEWWIAEPRELRADAKTVKDKLIDALDQATKFSPFEVRPSQLDEFGLGPASSPVEVRLSASGAKQKPLTLRLGKTTPIAGECYLLDAAEPSAVYVTTAALRDGLDLSLHALRDKTILPFPAKSVTAFQVETLRDAPPQPAALAAGETTSTLAVPHLTARRDAEGSWWISNKTTVSLRGGVPEKGFIRGDDRGINALLGAMATMEAVDTTTTPGLAARPGPSGEIVRLAIEYAQPPDDANPATTTARTSVSFGAAREGDAPVFRATREGSDLAYKVERGLLTRLLGPISTFRDPRVLRIALEDTAYVQIQVSNSAFALERGADGLWRFADDPDTPVNQVKANAYLAFCLSLHADSFNLGPEPPDAKKAGLEPPKFSLMVRNRDGSVRERFETGSRPERDDPGIYARRMRPEERNVEQPEGRSDEESGVSGMFLLALPPKYEVALFKSRHFFAVSPLLSFDKDRLAKIELILRPEKDSPVTNTLTVERQTSGGETLWQGSADNEPARTVPTRLADLLVSVLSDIEFQSDPDKKKTTPSLLQLYGLDRPYLTLRILDRDGEELDRLQLGIVSPALTEKQASLPEAQRSVLVATGQGGYRYVGMDSLDALNRAFSALAAQMR